MPRLTLTVNGRAVSAEAETRTLLADYRAHLILVMARRAVEAALEAK